MEIKKSESKPFVIIICVIVGLFLVGFGVWYGVSYFEGDEKPSNPEQQNSGIENNPLDDETQNEKDYNNLEIVGNKLELSDVTSYLKSDELINKITVPITEVKSDKFKYENNTLIITFEDNNKYKFTGVGSDIKGVYIDDCYDGACTLTVLTESGDLFKAGFGPEEEETVALTKINSNINSIKSKEGAVDYYIDNSGNYYKYVWNYEKNKTEFLKTDLEETYNYDPCGGGTPYFKKDSVKNSEVHFENVSVDSVVCYWDATVSTDTPFVVFIGKDKFLYKVLVTSDVAPYYDKYTFKIEKVNDKKVKNVSQATEKLGDAIINKVLIEFE